jgi:hypothetical protein
VLLFRRSYLGIYLKVCYEAAITPFTYLIVGFLKRREGVDFYDRTTSLHHSGLILSRNGNYKSVFVTIRMRKELNSCRNVRF